MRVVFRGRVTCRREPGPLGLTLAGEGSAAGTTYLALAGEAPADLPAELLSPEVLQLAPGRYRIACDASEWVILAHGHFLYRDVSRDFYAAVPPRRVPWRKRLFWKAVLWLAGTGAGRRLLAPPERRGPD
jgi:hypothetical protein